MAFYGTENILYILNIYFKIFWKWKIVSTYM